MSLEKNLNLFQRINEVRKKITYVQKEQNSSLRYAVVSHDDVTAKLRPALIEFGIVYFPVDMEVQQDGNRTEMQVDIRFQNIDDKDDYILVPASGYGIDNQDKGPGKAISYATKMALLKLFALETGVGEDPDFDQTTLHKPGKSVQTKTIKPIDGEKISEIKDKISNTKEVGELLVLWGVVQEIGVDNIPVSDYNSLVDAFKLRKLELTEKPEKKE